MATIYKATIEIVSEFVQYSEGDLHGILKIAIEQFKDTNTGLGLKTDGIYVEKKN